MEKKSFNYVKFEPVLETLLPEVLTTKEMAAFVLAVRNYFDERPAAAPHFRMEFVGATLTAMREYFDEHEVPAESRMELAEMVIRGLVTTEGAAAERLELQRTFSAAVGFEIALPD